MEVDNGQVTLARVEVEADNTLKETTKNTGHWAWKLQDGSLKLLTGDVRFKDVIFGYNEEKIVLKILIFLLSQVKDCFCWFNRSR